jgi:hypothetical protein
MSDCVGGGIDLPAGFLPLAKPNHLPGASNLLDKTGSHEAP